MTLAALVYAFTLGLVAAVNPCGFPLLPAYLAGFLASEHPSGWAPRTLRALVAGACVTAGFILTFGLAGVLVASGMALIGEWIPWVMLGVGAALAALGVSALAGRHVSIRLPAVRFRSGRGVAAMAGFGVAYAVGSLSCTLPLFLAGVVSTFTRAGFLSGLLSFVAYALGMGVFVPIAASVLVTVVGLYLVYYWGTDLIDPLASTPVTNAVASVQTVVSGWLTASPVGAAAVGAVTLAGIGALVWNSMRRANRREENSSNA